jgi:DNA repair protein RadD
MSVWSQLSKADLQAQLGEDLLNRMEGVLPALIDEEGSPTEDLFSTPTLVRLFEAFVAPSAVGQRSFRRALFMTCREEQLDRLIERLEGGPDEIGDFPDKVAWLDRQPWTNDGLAPAFITEFDLPQSLLPSQGAIRREREVLGRSSRPLKRLKDFQASVFYRTLECLSVPHGRVVLQMPTGSGKTRTAMEVVAAMLASPEPKGFRVAWLSHSGELCDQAADAFTEVWAPYADHDITLFRAWGRARGVPPQDVDGSWMWVCSLQMAHSLGQTGILPKADLIVVDEAHKVLAPTYREAVLSLTDEGTRVLGLTATPGRGMARDEENEALADFFFGQKETLEGIGAESPIAFLRRRRVLARLDREVLNTGVSVTVTQKKGRSADDVPEEVLKALGADDIRSAEIAARLASAAELGKSCLLFATSVEHSKFVTALLGFLGVRAAHIDGSTPGRQREQTIEKFRSREIDVLSNYGVLTTGFDAPSVDFLCIARPTNSLVLYSQMLGRGLRGPAIGGTESCQVLDVMDNIIGMPDIEEMYLYFDEYYGG